MLSKSLIQFSVDGWGCVPSLLFDLRPYYGGGDEDNGDLLQKAPCMQCSPQCPLTLKRATINERLHWRLLDTHGQVWLSLLWGHCSFLLGPDVKVLFVPSKCLFPQSCVSSCGSMVGLMATSSKRAYAIPRSAAPRAPAPAAVHWWSVPSQETLRHSSGQSLRGLCVLVWTRFVWAIWAYLVGKGLIQNAIPPLLPSCWGFSFALPCGVSFLLWDPTFSSQWLLVATCSFGDLAGEDERMSFYSASWKSLPSSVLVHCFTTNKMLLTFNTLSHILKVNCNEV